MRIPVHEIKKRFPGRPEPAPLKMAGQWVAWNSDRSRIVAHGIRFEEVRAEAIAAGCAEPVMHRVIGAPFVGAA